MKLLPQFASRRDDDDISHLLNRIHHADAMDLLARLPDKSVDMVLCDLPYGTTQAFYDTIIPLAPLWEHLKRVIKERGAIVLTATQPFSSLLVSSNYEMFKYEWVWRKRRKTNFLNAKIMPLTGHEVAIVFGHHMPNYYPQMIPIKTYTQENEIVLDMTCGSGTTAIAARKCNRQFICGDNHLPYVELARERLQTTDPYKATIYKDGRTQLSLFEDVS